MKGACLCRKKEKCSNGASPAVFVRHQIFIDKFHLICYDDFMLKLLTSLRGNKVTQLPPPEFSCGVCSKELVKEKAYD